MNGSYHTGKECLDICSFHHLSTAQNFCNFVRDRNILDRGTTKSKSERGIEVSVLEQVKRMVRETELT